MLASDLSVEVPVDDLRDDPAVLDPRAKALLLHHRPALGVVVGLAPALVLRVAFLPAQAAALVVEPAAPVGQLARGGAAAHGGRGRHTGVAGAGGGVGRHVAAGAGVVLGLGGGGGLSLGGGLGGGLGLGLGCGLSLGVGLGLGVDIAHQEKDLRNRILVLTVPRLQSTVSLSWCEKRNG